MIPTLKVLAADRKMFGAPACVYLWLLTHHLDTVSFCTVKQAGVAASLHVSRTTVRRALELLVHDGYLQARPAPAGRGLEYRVRWTLPPAPLPSPPARRGPARGVPGGRGATPGEEGKPKPKPEISQN